MGLPGKQPVHLCVGGVGWCPTSYVTTLLAGEPDNHWLHDTRCRALKVLQVLATGGRGCACGLGSHCSALHLSMPWWSITTVLMVSPFPATLSPSLARSTLDHQHPWGLCPESKALPVHACVPRDAQKPLWTRVPKTLGGPGRLGFGGQSVGSFIKAFRKQNLAFAKHFPL